MGGTVLVKTKNTGDIGTVAPYVTRIAQTGNRVVFLVPTRPDKFGRFRAWLAVINGGDFGLLASQALAEWCSAEQHRNSVEKLIASARKELENKGVIVEVHLCYSSMSSTLKNYAASGDVELVVMPAGFRTKLVNLLRKAKDRLFGRSGSLPALILELQRI